jgi:hypothetical protein
MNFQVKEIGSVILNQVPQDIAAYDISGLHYNLAAEGIYRARLKFGDPFCQAYQPYIIAGLVAFDMQRMMGSEEKAPNHYYDPSAGGFAARLQQKLHQVSAMLKHVPTSATLSSVKDHNVMAAIRDAHDCLAASGEGALHRTDRFSVGATKILHWLNPDLFIMIDQNVARAFSKHHRIDYANSTQPGYTGAKYAECLRCAQEEIRRYGDEKFVEDAPGLPQARAFDKVAFVVGVRLKKRSTSNFA